MFTCPDLDPDVVPINLNLFQVHRKAVLGSDTGLLQMFLTFTDDFELLVFLSGNSEQFGSGIICF